MNSSAHCVVDAGGRLASLCQRAPNVALTRLHASSGLEYTTSAQPHRKTTMSAVACWCSAYAWGRCGVHRMNCERTGQARGESPLTPPSSSYSGVTDMLSACCPCEVVPEAARLRMWPRLQSGARLEHIASRTCAAPRLILQASITVLSGNSTTQCNS